MKQKIYLQLCFIRDNDNYPKFVTNFIDWIRYEFFEDCMGMGEH
jgi:hypothetical protein